MSSSRTLDLARKIPITKKNFIHPWLRLRVRWHHRFKKEDFRTLDKRNQENSRFLCRLIHNDRIETTAYVAKWATILGNRVLELAFMGPEVKEARSDIEDIFFLRLYKERQYHIDKLYNELVPQLEYVDGELIRTQFLGFNHERQLKCVMEFANNGLPALPIPEETYQIRRPLTYPEILEREQKRITEELRDDVHVSSQIEQTDVIDTSREMLALLPEAKRIQIQREFNTQLDFEGDTLAWQAERIKREVKSYVKRYEEQEERNEQLTRGEKVKQYHKIRREGYRIKLPPFARPEGLTEEDYNNGYDKLYQRVLQETKG